MKKDRSEYQRKYASANIEKKREQKELERDRRDRCRSYWYAKLILKRDMSALIADCSPELVEKERVKYEMLLAETA